MASVTSLDNDMKKLRLSKYTPGAANQARTWIESTLGEKLASGDLIEALKDGTALCRLANLALPPPGIKFKKSPMPFIQMENISHFLRACEMPPLNLPSHDRFLTVDLYESKDPAQVLQCLSAFSRVANSVSPANFPTTIGPKKGSVLSPQTTGPATPNGSMAAPFSKSRPAPPPQGTSTFNPIARERALSPTLTGGSNSSKTTDGGTKSPGTISSWSKKTDEGITAPAWNIHQYGYMGGANQGSQGVAFGARRQITTAAPHVPGRAEKERKRKEQEAEAERARLQAEEAERQMRLEREAEDERERQEEERRWAEQTRRQREEEKRRVEEQKREWEEQERMWKAEEERRVREEQEALDRAEMETKRKRATSDARLRGQYLSEYQQEKPAARSSSRPRSRRNSTDDRVRELERQLEEAKAREQEYEREREERRRDDDQRRANRRNRSRSRSRPKQAQRPPSPKESELSWTGDEREYLRQQWADSQARSAPQDIPSRPLPDPKTAASAAPLPPKSPRPLPDPATYRPPPQMQQQPQQQYKPPVQQAPPQYKPQAQQPPPQQYKPQAQQPPQQQYKPPAQQPPQQYKPPKPAPQPKMGWSSKSTLLEREMERERQRQQEWEESQERTRGLTPDRTEGSGIGKTWDINQYGYTGGDNQSRGATGIGFGARRQIIGPRPPPS